MAEWSDPRVITSIATVVIALCSLALTIWQSRATQKHNRLMSRPNLTVDTQFYSLEGYVGIRLVNSGNGPLIIKGATVTRGEKKKSLFDREYPTLLKEVNYAAFHFTVLAEGQHIRPGDEVWLFSTNSHHEYPDISKHVEDAVTHTRLQFEYESMYGEKFNT
ncbi:hypothetical protein [Shewanella algae]|uniref:hypothetical protein n=1 Tax=Shewanella algae TaxID=38313 RepID=UPI0031F59664